MEARLRRTLVVLFETICLPDFLVLAPVIEEEAMQLGYFVFFFSIQSQPDNITYFLDQAKGDCYLISADLGIERVVEKLLRYPKPIGLLQTTFRDSFFGSEESRSVYITSIARHAVRKVSFKHQLDYGDIEGGLPFR